MDKLKLYRIIRDDVIDAYNDNVTGYTSALVVATDAIQARHIHPGEMEWQDYDDFQCPEEGLDFIQEWISTWVFPHNVKAYYICDIENYDANSMVLMSEPNIDFNMK